MGPGTSKASFYSITQSIHLSDLLIFLKQIFLKQFMALSVKWVKATIATEFDLWRSNGSLNIAENILMDMKSI